MFDIARPVYQQILAQIDDAGLTKHERIIRSPQGAGITADPGGRVINFCANNYLGLASHPEVVKAAHDTMEKYGYGLSSVRFICGTQSIHKDLEAAISRYLTCDDTILYSSCFDANAGLFETLLGPEDEIISDQLNHASIIDGVRLCKAHRSRYPNGDMNALEESLKNTQDKRLRLIATDGVFSMDGCYAKLGQICDLADKYGAMVMVDDSHATGFVGKTGRGTPELCGVIGRVDVITSTLGKALGGASGGFTAGRKEIIDLLRQRSRPYLFSNTLAPGICGASLKVISMLEASTKLRDKLEATTIHFREEMDKLGFEILPGTHPIVPVMFGEARKATAAADKLLEEGIYVIGFSYPVVPKGQARIRVQLSAAHKPEHVAKAISGFAKLRD